VSTSISISMALALIAFSCVATAEEHLPCGISTDECLSMSLDILESASTDTLVLVSTLENVSDEVTVSCGVRVAGNYVAAIDSLRDSRSEPPMVCRVWPRRFASERGPLLPHKARRDTFVVRIQPFDPGAITFWCEVMIDAMICRHSTRRLSVSSRMAELRVAVPR
jgi:hypothetical protein